MVSAYLRYCRDGMGARRRNGTYLQPEGDGLCRISDRRTSGSSVIRALPRGENLLRPSPGRLRLCSLWNAGAKIHTAATMIRAEIYFSSSTFWKWVTSGYFFDRRGYAAMFSIAGNRSRRCFDGVTTATPEERRPVRQEGRGCCSEQPKFVQLLL